MTLALSSSRLPATRVPPRAARVVPRVAVIHPSDVVRTGLSVLLGTTAGCQVVVATDALSEARRQMADRDPALVLFAWSSATGSAAASLISEIWEDAKQIALVEEHTIGATEVLSSRVAAAVVITSVNREGIAALVRHVLEGERGLALGFRTADGVEQRLGLESGLIARLTRRERELFHLVGEGLSNAEIAELLAVSIKTVETHRTNMGRKLGIRTRPGLVRAALGSWRNHL